MDSLVDVKWLNNFVALAVLALWLPAMNHCRLEQIPGLAFLICCEHEETAPHQDDDCATDGCDVVENGLYKTESFRITVAAPALTSLPWLLVAPIDPLPPAPASAGGETAPPELPKLWQFSFRTALPPRAPSLLS